MKSFLALLLAVPIAGGFAGCNSSMSPVNGGPSGLNAEIQGVVAIDPSADPNNSGVFADDETVEAAASPLGTASPMSVIPDSINLCWYRHVTQTSRTLNSTGDSANMTVTLTRDNTGWLVGRLCDDYGRGHGRTKLFQADSVAFRKGFKVTWTRMAVFNKVAPNSPDTDRDEEGTRWILRATTLAHEAQDSPSVANPPVIQSVTIAGQDSAGNPLQIVFDDPTKLIDVATLPDFADGDPVTVTVRTNNPSAQAAFIHFDQANTDHPMAWRRPLAFNGTDAFVGSFQVRPGHGGGHFRGRRVRQAVWVDVLNKDSLRDTDAPYASDGWGLPYRLRAPGHGNHSVALSLHE